MSYLFNHLAAASLAGLVLCTLPAAAQNHTHPGANSRPPLYTDLGTHGYDVSTHSPEAQDYFNQGMRLYYAFNHQEAIRSFRRAQEIDPTCAMCWFGEALSWGPNINLAMDAEAGKEAWRAIQQAEVLVEHATARERAMIRALASRYSPDPAADRASLDSTYAARMSTLASQFPSDPEIRVLAAEAIMTTMPWDYWDSAAHPRQGIDRALHYLESVVASNSVHPGACHFYIHAVEKYFPERAVECAERLRDLMPGAGHLVHMPGHIYIRVGRYLDAISVNEHAVHADESYIQDQNPSTGVYTVGYYPHNYDFLAFAAAMIGRSKQAIDAASAIQRAIPEAMLAEPGFTFAQHYATRTLQMLVRFQRWNDVLEVPSPGKELHHGRAMWHYATGRALAATGNLDGARDHLDALGALKDSEALAGVPLEFNLSTDILTIAQKVLAGYIAAEERDLEEAIRLLERGLAVYDQLTYGEPPEWSIPVRHDLGTLLLNADRFEEAEAVFRRDLDLFPANGWGLHGLTRALDGQGRTAEASLVRQEFNKVWETADIRLPD